jgi:hypothetical protein
VFSNKTAVATGIIGLLLGLLIGMAVGAVRGYHYAVQVWAGPDYVNRLLDRCWFEEMIAIDAKRQGLTRFDSSSGSLRVCLMLIDSANENLPLSKEQQVWLRQHKKMLLKNFPELALPPPAVKLSPEEQARLRQAKEDVLRNLPAPGTSTAAQKPAGP